MELKYMLFLPQLIPHRLWGNFASGGLNKLCNASQSISFSVFRFRIVSSRCLIVLSYLNGPVNIWRNWLPSIIKKQKAICKTGVFRTSGNFNNLIVIVSKPTADWGLQGKKPKGINMAVSNEGRFQVWSLLTFICCILHWSFHLLGLLDPNGD